jgi:hypothetical protein
MAEKIEVWLNSEPALTETDKGGEMENGVGRKVAQRQTHQNQKITEERNGWQTETANKVVFEDYHLSGVGCRERLTSRWPPTNHFLRRKHSGLHQLGKTGLGRLRRLPLPLQIDGRRGRRGAAARASAA